MESSVHFSRKSLCSCYVTLTEDEEKRVSVITPEVRHGHDIWLVNHRKNEATQGARSVKDLEDYYVYYYTRDQDDIAKANNTLHFIGIRLLAETVARHVPDKQAKMIDVGAGTGDFGVKLKQVGFTKIDALEPSGRLVNLMPEDLYGTIYKELLSADTPTSIPNGGCIIFNISDIWFNYKGFGASIDAWLQSNLEDGTLESVLKERSVYMYNKEDCSHYIIKTSSKK